MRKPVLLALSLAFLVSAQSALAAGDAGNFGTPIKSGVSVSFPDSSATFQPTPEALELLADARNAAIIYISGRTSTLRPSAADEALALRRALSARSYLVARGVAAQDHGELRIGRRFRGRQLDGRGPAREPARGH
ncbi:OmpA family protein [Burkholderia contaminans]|uniref:OmpA family protein n=1 Tax=Burkholderia contaminans TaxID=488447 RepID=UPI001CEDFFB7|nr:OmpA family protein [Burkholderia contaminans]